MEEIVADKSSSDVKETSGKNASPSLSSDFLNTSAIDIVPAKSCNDVQETDDNGSPSETAESVECKNCPEAITEYLQHFTYHAERRKTLLELTTNARKHLLSTGWQIQSEMRKGSLQATFTFPEKIGYYSLEEACLGCFSDKQNCPEAITKYRRFLLTSHSAGRKSLSVLSSNAQRTSHLQDGQSSTRANLEIDLVKKSQIDSLPPSGRIIFHFHKHAKLLGMLLHHNNLQNRPIQSPNEE